MDSLNAIQIVRSFVVYFYGRRLTWFLRVDGMKILLLLEMHYCRLEDDTDLEQACFTSITWIQPLPNVSNSYIYLELLCQMFVYRHCPIKCSTLSQWCPKYCVHHT